MNRRDFLTTSAIVGATLPTLASHASEQVVAAKVDSSVRRKVLIPTVAPDVLAEWTEVAPTLELVQCRNQKEAIEQVGTAEASIGFINRDLILAGKSLKWVQQPSAGVEVVMEIPELVESGILLTNMQRAYAPQIADQTLGYLLAFTRHLDHFIRIQSKQEWPKGQQGFVLDELPGKTLLVIGLGGIGSEVARRAAAFGMNVLATDPKVIERPLFVAELHRPDVFHSLLPRADVIVSAVPLTKVSRKMFGEREFGMMKKGVIFINVSRGGVVDTDALIAALDSKKVSAAGLDVTDPEPLPTGHPLWTRNVIITPHNAAMSTGTALRRNAVIKENLRRFSAGEALINLVDKAVGY